MLHDAIADPVVEPPRFWPPNVLVVVDESVVFDPCGMLYVDEQLPLPQDAVPLQARGIVHGPDW